jgi:hypothetical protein
MFLDELCPCTQCFCSVTDQSSWPSRPVDSSCSRASSGSWNASCRPWRQLGTHSSRTQDKTCLRTASSSPGASNYRLLFAGAQVARAHPASGGRTGRGDSFHRQPKAPRAQRTTAAQLCCPHSPENTSLVNQALLLFSKLLPRFCSHFVDVSSPGSAIFTSQLSIGPCEDRQKPAWHGVACLPPHNVALSREVSPAGELAGVTRWQMSVAGQTAPSRQELAACQALRWTL